MLRFRSLSAFACLVLAGSGPALAAPRSIGECESLKNDLAYNQCLAMFGPEARNVGGGDGGGGGGMSIPAATASASAAEPVAAEEAVQPARGRRGRARYGRRGRQVAAFAIGGGEEGGGRSYRRRRRH